MVLVMQSILLSIMEESDSDKLYSERVGQVLQVLMPFHSQNVIFGENSSKYWQNNGYDQDYDCLIRPYVFYNFY